MEDFENTSVVSEDTAIASVDTTPEYDDDEMSFGSTVAASAIGTGISLGLIAIGTWAFKKFNERREIRKAVKEQLKAQKEAAKASEPINVDAEVINK